MKPEISVVICTLGIAETLTECVSAALDQRGVNHEVVVVVNGPSSTYELTTLRATVGDANPHHTRLRIVHEPTPGLSYARNCGSAAADGDLIAFTDDDAIADPNWLANLRDRFNRDADTAAVTGRVLTADPDNNASRWFDEGFGFDRGTHPMAWNLDAAKQHRACAQHAAHPGRRGAAYPFASGDLGSGNNFAFRSDWLQRWGGFDPVLGAGSPTRGGEDLDALRAVLLDGYTVAYEPSAVITHHHRSTLTEFRRQAFGYGAGMAASLLRLMVRRPAQFLGLIPKLPASVRVLLSPESVKNINKSADFPASVTWAELAGYAAGPVLTLQSWCTQLRRRKARL